MSQHIEHQGALKVPLGEIGVKLEERRNQQKKGGVTDSPAPVPAVPNALPLSVEETRSRIKAQLETFAAGSKVLLAEDVDMVLNLERFIASVDEEEERLLASKPEPLYLEAFRETRGAERERAKEDLKAFIRQNPGLLTLVPARKRRDAEAARLLKVVEDIKPSESRITERIANVLGDAVKSGVLTQREDTETANGDAPVQWSRYFYSRNFPDELACQLLERIRKVIEDFRDNKKKTSESAERELAAKGLLVPAGDLPRRTAGTLHELMEGACDRAVLFIQRRDGSGRLAVERHAAVAADNINVALAVFRIGDRYEPKPFAFDPETGKFGSRSNYLAEELSAAWERERGAMEREADIARVLASVEQPLTLDEFKARKPGRYPFRVESWIPKGEQRRAMRFAGVFESTEEGFCFSGGTKDALKACPWLKEQYGAITHFDALQSDKRLVQIMQQAQIADRIAAARAAGARYIDDTVDVFNNFLEGVDGLYILDVKVYASRRGDDRKRHRLAIITVKDGLIHAVETLGELARHPHQYTEPVSIGDLDWNWLKYALRHVGLWLFQKELPPVLNPSSAPPEEPADVGDSDSSS